MGQYPDFEYIREKLSIVTVARELGLTVYGYRARCWRTEHHRNGDADPSIGLWKKKNRGRCFVCDAHTWSTIDLVMMVRGCELSEAISWITNRFLIPMLPKGSHAKKREQWSPRFRSDDVGNVGEMLVRSGLWSNLSNAERSILLVLITFVNRDTGLAEISYRGLMRFSGVGSPATIASALHHFEQMKFLRIVRARSSGPVRRVSQYQFTLEDPDFQSMMAKVFQQQRAEIELEKQFQVEERKARLKSIVHV